MTNETKQTAVDWQFDQLSSENLLGIFTHDQMTRVMEILEQSNKMFKEQIEDAIYWGNIKGYDEHKRTWIDDEDQQYYNETFGGNNEQ
jgi:hypothetical protein